jgi:cobalamin synthase
MQDRCFGVYGSSALIGLAGLSILVPTLRRHLHHPEQALYLAAALLRVVTMVFSLQRHRERGLQRVVARKVQTRQLERITSLGS